MKCTFNYQAGGGCKQESTHLVERIPLCKTHGSVIVWRIGTFRKRLTPYVEIDNPNPTELTEELSHRVCEKCDGYGWVEPDDAVILDMCPDCLGTGFAILEEKVN